MVLQSIFIFNPRMNDLDMSESMEMFIIQGIQLKKKGKENEVDGSVLKLQYASY